MSKNKTERRMLASDLICELQRGIDLLGDFPVTHCPYGTNNRCYLQNLTVVKMPQSDKMVFDLSDTGEPINGYKDITNMDCWFSMSKYKPTEDMVQINRRFLCVVSLYEEHIGSWIQAVEVLIFDVLNNRWLTEEGEEYVDVYHTVTLWRPFDYMLMSPGAVKGAIYPSQMIELLPSLNDGVYLVCVEHTKDVNGTTIRTGMHFMTMLFLRGTFVDADVFRRRFPGEETSYVYSMIPVPDRDIEQFTWSPEDYAEDSERGLQGLFEDVEYRRKLLTYYESRYKGILKKC